MREFFCTVLEENYHMMLGWNLVDDPKDGYHFIYITGILAMGTPVWLGVYIFSLYKFY